MRRCACAHTHARAHHIASSPVAGPSWVRRASSNAFFPHARAWGCFLRPASSQISPRPAVAGQLSAFPQFPGIFTARAWFGSRGLGRAGGFPSGSAGLGLPFPNGGSITFWPAGRLAGGLSGSRPLPSRLPSCSYPGLWPQGSAGGALQPGCSEIFIGVSIRMRAVGVLRAFRSRFIGAGLPDALGSSDFQGNLVSLLGSHPVASVFGLAAPGLACFDPHLVLGFCGLCVDEVARGSHSPRSRRDTNRALCLRAAGGRQRARALPGLRGNALEFEDVKTQIKTTSPRLHLGNPSSLVGEDCMAGSPFVTGSPFGDPE